VRSTCPERLRADVEFRSEQATTSVYVTRIYTGTSHHWWRETVPHPLPPRRFSSEDGDAGGVSPRGGRRPGAIVGLHSGPYGNRVRGQPVVGLARNLGRGLHTPTSVQRRVGHAYVGTRALRTAGLRPPGAPGPFSRPPMGERESSERRSAPMITPCLRRPAGAAPGPNTTPGTRLYEAELPHTRFGKSVEDTCAAYEREHLRWWMTCGFAHLPSPRGGHDHETCSCCWASVSACFSGARGW